jgi:crotonobetainyl-CoA:carnitine CoA-transferase CaiB-like acyl-CoA transferase
MKPLANVGVLTLANNLPGPVAVARLHELGAGVVKVEPPQGDALFHARPDWYQVLHQGCEILHLDLKRPEDRAQLAGRLTAADLLITATRPAALHRLGLTWPELHARYPRLCHVAILGHPPPDEELPGHDLTYQARAGLVVPPHLPRTCIADMAGAQDVVSAALGVMLARERGQGCHSVQVSLALAAESMAEPLRHGLTVPGGPLGGGLPGYNLYQTSDGWIAIAALEAHFWEKLSSLVGTSSPNQTHFQSVFLTRTSQEWEAWGRERDLPIAVVREQPLQG